MANFRRVSVRLMALAKIVMVIGIIVLVLLSVRVYLSQQGPALHHWHTGGLMKCLCRRWITRPSQRMSRGKTPSSPLSTLR